MCVFLYLYIHVFGHCTFTCFDLYLDLYLDGVTREVGDAHSSGTSGFSSST